MEQEPVRGPGAPVLIADDERPVAMVIAAVVEEAGHRPLVALHGRQALEMAQEEWPALLITNLMMPRIDGAGLIAALRAEAGARDLPAVPAILVTAVGLDKAGAVGADVTLPKPFDIDQLDRLLDRFLPRGDGA